MIRKFETREEEILTILAEECAEVIQEIMKCKRKNSYQSDDLEKEIGDLVCMLRLAQEYKITNKSRTNLRAYEKTQKLKEWSNIFN